MRHEGNLVCATVRIVRGPGAGPMVPPVDSPVIEVSSLEAEKRTDGRPFLGRFLVRGIEVPA